MNDKLEKLIQNNKTPGFINPETCVLKLDCFHTYMVLIFSDLNGAQIYEMPYRESPYHEIEIRMSFIYLNLFKPNEHKEDCRIEKLNGKIFPFQVKVNEYVYVGEEELSFEINEMIMSYSLEHGSNDIKVAFAHGKKNIYFMLHQKYIPVEEYQHKKMNMSICIKRMIN